MMRVPGRRLLAGATSFLLALLSAACGGPDISDPIPPGPLTALTVVEGAGQTGTVGTQLTQPLGVRAVDASGQVIAGQLVVFTVVSGGGSVFGGTVQTGPEGEARDRWTLGGTAGAQVVRARAVDPGTGVAAEVEFNATALPGPATQVTKAGGDGQRAPAGTQLPVPLSALVQDGFGNPVPGVPVTFSVTSGGGQLSVQSSPTNAAGVASTAWTLGDVGVQEAKASLSGGASVTFSATVALPELLWETLASMPYAVRAATAATDGAKIYVFGGWASGPTNHTQIYDVAAGTWSTGAPVPIALNFAMAAASPAGIHLIGGGDEHNKFSTHYLYSPQNDSWSARASLSQGLDGSALMRWEDRLFLFGGNHGGSAVTTTARVYDPSADQWTSLRAMPTARLSPAGAVLDGTLVVSGGWATDGLQVVEAYTPSTDSWTALPSLPERREAHAAGVVGGRLCVTGGRRTRGSSPYASTRCLESVQAGWSDGPPMPAARDEVGYVVLGGALYVFGGGTFGPSPAVYRLYEGYR